MRKKPVSGLGIIDLALALPLALPLALALPHIPNLISHDVCNAYIQDRQVTRVVVGMGNSSYSWGIASNAGWVTAVGKNGGSYFLPSWIGMCHMARDCEFPPTQIPT